MPKPLINFNRTNTQTNEGFKENENLVVGFYLELVDSNKTLRVKENIDFNVSFFSEKNFKTGQKLI